MLRRVSPDGWGKISGMFRRYAPFVLSALLAGSASAAMSLPFIENDFEKAMETAKAQHRPVFVEVWAPW